jgi:transposase InsO family protein
MHKEKILGQEFTQLCLPLCRRAKVLELGHELGAHLGPKRTSQRIRLSFYWSTIMSDCKQHCKVCVPCQKKARITFRDRVPIHPIPRADIAFSHWFMDILGPITSAKCDYNYCLILVDSSTRYPAAFALRSITAKSVCDCLLSLFEHFGVASVVSSDNASNFCSKLNLEFCKRLGCSPRFNSCYHPQSTGLVERMVGTTKMSIAKMAADYPKSWHK